MSTTFCMRCGHQNDPQQKYCEKCNAVLLSMLGESSGESPSLEIEEGREYLLPQQSYPTEHLYVLTCRAYEFLHEGAPIEPFREAFGDICRRLDLLEDEQLPEMVRNLDRQAAEDAEDDYPRQVRYLLTTGVAMCREGVGLVERFLESGDPDELIQGVTKLQEGNDRLVYAHGMGAERLEIFRQELNRRQHQDRIDAAQRSAGASARAEETAPEG